ncbi:MULTISPECIES: LysR family transcriptional regulator [Nitrospirillum]|uniref:DNA-binding transcriptional LysR family regulator n=1 Tax=Nitrospirillum amazonense TaxID=28077 RepID=A0A560GDP9_9PROT|nr:LysR family transcriptional regulator [Nitrospirillum amazonense]MEC4591864.1 LysR family transcriptional regulator [Nitrospirillum amazonense]TWB31864.1 DNA-binding transcriptional LysR family regulator [Nitrospirillum amazonense]
MDWDRVRVFHTVAEAGSFTHAGAVLALSQSAISRQISSLEQQLKARLFHRHARGLVLTEQGEVLYQTARDVIDRLAMAEARVSDSLEQAGGTLRISTTAAFAQWLAPRLKAFQDRHADVRVVLQLDEGNANLALRQADVAIRMGAPSQLDLIQRPLFATHIQAYATADYVRAHGLPQRPEDLDGHRLIAYRDSLTAPGSALAAEGNWLLYAGVGEEGGRQPALAVDDAQAVHLAIRSGLGIGTLPCFFAEDAKAQDQGLIRILPAVPAPRLDAYLVYAVALRGSKRIGAFRDFVMHELRKAPMGKAA